MRIISVGISPKKLTIIKGSDYSLRTGRNGAVQLRDAEVFSLQTFVDYVLFITIYIYSNTNGFVERAVRNIMIIHNK